MNKAVIAIVIGIAAVAGTLTIVQATNAFGWGMGSERNIDTKAEILGVNADTLKQELETKSFEEVLQSHGLTREAFRQKMDEQATERMKQAGLSDEEIQQRLEARETRRQEMLQWQTDVLGIDVATLQEKLNDKTFPELLDEYGITHVQLHEKMRERGGEFHMGMKGAGFGMHGF